MAPPFRWVAIYAQPHYGAPRHDPSPRDHHGARHLKHGYIGPARSASAFRRLPPPAHPLEPAAAPRGGDGCDDALNGCDDALVAMTHCMDTYIIYTYVHPIIHALIRRHMHTTCIHTYLPTYIHFIHSLIYNRGRKARGLICNGRAGRHVLRGHHQQCHYVTATALWSPDHILVLWIKINPLNIMGGGRHFAQ